MKHRAWIVGLVLLAISPGAIPAQAQLFGPSDEEKAHEQDQDDQLAQLKDQLKTQTDQYNARLQQLEDKVQSLTDSLAQATGANEELTHQIALLNQKIDREQKDFSYRLCMLSAQQLGAGDQGLNCADAGTPPPGPPPNRFAPGTSLAPLGSNGGDAAIPQPGRSPGILGTLSGSGPANAAPAGDAAQFDSAMNLLSKAQFTEASAGFRAYADAHPDDQDLSSQALYWVGHIAFIRQDYPNAARTFAEELKKYPAQRSSPDAMLQLGQSLIAEGQTSGGCTTLGLLSKKYPDASASTVAAATGARKSSCSK